ncbi:MAG TPA: transglutaminase-like domain-containing protein [Thermoanaerobaculia bacterium]|nr:transglutaminase-like domain-containing protein [Thermoanaerobaculia bacterium]
MVSPVLIHRSEARRQLREFAAGEISNENLARGALLLALEDYPQLDVEDVLAQLDDLAARVVRRSSPAEPAIFRLGHLHAEMFDVDGYQGDTGHYYDPRNAYLNEVVERKLGIPISLSIIFLHVATGVGLSAFGVGLPGHYVVKVQFELNEVYVDPFHGGGTLTVPEISDLLAQMTGGKGRLSSEHLRAWDGRETLLRVAANMQNMWARAGDGRRANSARERVEILRG